MKKVICFDNVEIQKTNNFDSEFVMNCPDTFINLDNFKNLKMNNCEHFCVLKMSKSKK